VREENQAQSFVVCGCCACVARDRSSDQQRRARLSGRLVEVSFFVLAGLRSFYIG
jgi:hypothetical protein